MLQIFVLLSEVFEPLLLLHVNLLYYPYFCQMLLVRNMTYFYNFILHVNKWTQLKFIKSVSNTRFYYCWLEISVIYGFFSFIDNHTESSQQYKNMSYNLYTKTFSNWKHTSFKATILIKSIVIDQKAHAQFVIYHT